ncbi:MAG TPA: S41 family peptidase [Candidatus Anoxymicrobiaceae bacterium]
MDEQQGNNQQGGQMPPQQWQQPPPPTPGQPPQGQYPPPGQPQQPQPPQQGQYPPPGQPQQPQPPQGQYYQQPQYGAPPPPPPRKRMSRGKAVILGIVVGLLAVGALVGIGFAIDKTVFQKSAANFKLSNQAVYNEALFDIKSYYYKPFSEAKITAAANAAVAKAKKKGVTSTIELTNTGVTGLVNALGDSHSEYLTPIQNQRLSQDLSGSFFGVGFTLKEANKRPVVVSVIKGSPSDKAGIQAGDIIMSVDGKDTKGESLDNVVLRIRGKQGTKVKLQVKRGTKTLTYTITREKIQIPDFESSMMDGKYGYLHLFEFNKGVGDKVRAAVKDLQAKGAQGFILDVRNNPGGLLDEAVNVASLFLPTGTPVVSIQNKGQKRTEYVARGGAETTKPLVVLANQGSASASEIVTGALKDDKRAEIVGTKTYGKGSVQNVFSTGNGGAVKLTISLYYLPNGESIDGKGITPDVVVAVKGDPAKEDSAQMDMAKHVLQNMIEGKPPTSLLLKDLPIAA